MGFFAFILYQLIGLFVFVMFVWIIMGWLYQFGVLSTSNRFVSQVYDFLERLVSPVLAPLRGVVPPINGIDISPVLLVIFLVGVQRYILIPLM